MSKHSLLRYLFHFIWPIFLLMAIVPATAYSQNTSISATLNKTNFLVDEPVILTVTVVDDSAQQPRPILPRLDGLAIIDLDISTNVEINQSHFSTEVIYIYTLQPRRTGLLTIPPVWVRIDGDVFKTPPLSINVTEGSTAPADNAGQTNPTNTLTDEDFFIESEIDVLNPYINQQIIHTFRSYRTAELAQEPTYEPPNFEGFETMGLPVREYSLDRGNRTYWVKEIRTALFPQEAGKISILPERVKLEGNSIENLLDLYTDPLTVKVKPLPDHAPPDFSGAVGHYEINAWIEPRTITVYEPASLFVSVYGSGNIHALSEPAWPDLENWRAYNTFASLSVDMQDDGLMTGTSIFERLIVPDEIGEFTVPPIRMVYFDPLADEYQTIVTEPQTFKVIPQSTPAAQLPAPAAAGPTNTPMSVAANADTPDQIDPVNRIFPDSLETELGLTVPVTAGFFIILCLVIPLTAAAGAGGLWLWQRRAAQPEKVAKPVEPENEPAASSPHVHPILARAMQQYEDNYKAINQAVIMYLENKLGLIISGLTRPEVARYLHRAGIEATYVQQINTCLAQCEMGRYGPITDDDGWLLMAKVDELLFALDGWFEKNE